MCTLRTNHRPPSGSKCRARSRQSGMFVLSCSCFPQLPPLPSLPSASSAADLPVSGPRIQVFQGRETPGSLALPVGGTRMDWDCEDGECSNCGENSHHSLHTCSAIGPERDLNGTYRPSRRSLAGATPPPSATLFDRSLHTWPHSMLAILLHHRT